MVLARTFWLGCPPSITVLTRSETLVESSIDLNSFEGIEQEVTVTLGQNGSGTASYGLIVEMFAGIEEFFNATIS